MKLVLNGITYHTCPVEVREKVAFNTDQRRFMLRQMHAEPAVSEAVILQTCNRLEFYLYAKKDFDSGAFLTELIGQVRPDAADAWIRCRTESLGMDMVRHLFEVAAGLDSQMIGENQVLSQVKSAYTESVECRMSKLVFHRLFHHAFRVGKVVRTDTNINCGAVSIGLAAVELARQKIDLSVATALVIGAGENAELVARYLLKSGLSRLIIANRDHRKAEAVRDRLKKGQAVGLDSISAKLAEVDLVISSTASAEPIVTYEAVENMLARRDKPLLMIDIAVPRDIEPSIAQFKCVTLYNIDDLNERIISSCERRSNEIPKARALVAEFVDGFSKWYDSLNVVPVISRLMRKSTDLARSEARRYAKDFGRGNRDKLEAFAESLVKKLLHGPISYMKAGDDGEASTEQLQAVELINKMFLSQEERD
jgi:glutamyl-tRNA reductase